MKKTSPGRKLLQNAEEIVASLLFVVTLVLVIINVLMRYVFRSGLPWAEEMATSCFVWTAFIGAAACYKRRAHVGVDILINRFPLPVKNAVNILADLFLAFLCGYMFYISCIYIHRSYRKPTAILGISSVWVSVSLTIAFLDMAVWSAVFVVRDLRSLRENGSVVISGEEEKK